MTKQEAEEFVTELVRAYGRSLKAATLTAVEAGTYQELRQRAVAALRTVPVSFARPGAHYWAVVSPSESVQAWLREARRHPSASREGAEIWRDSLEGKLPGGFRPAEITRVQGYRTKGEALAASFEDEIGKAGRVA